MSRFQVLFEFYMTLSENKTNLDTENDISSLIRNLKIKYPGKSPNTKQKLRKIAQDVQNQEQNSSTPKIVKQFLQERHGKEN